MPSKKKKYNARFPAGRIKKIMQTDEEVGKVAQAVPVIISRTLELFVESLLTKSMQVTQSRNAKTLTPSHMKQCILSESRFDFLKDLVKNIPDASAQEDNENNASDISEYSATKSDESSEIIAAQTRTEIVGSFYAEQGTSTNRMPVIQYGPKVTQQDTSRVTFPLDNVKPENKLHVDLTKIPPLVPTSPVLPHTNFSNSNTIQQSSSRLPDENVLPQLIPISHNIYPHSTGDTLYIDEDYDN